jgi:hypothetical protein
MAQSKSRGITGFLFRILIQAVQIFLIVIALIYIVNVAGAWLVHVLRPGCHSNRIYDILTMSDYFLMLFLAGGIYLCRKAL